MGNDTMISLQGFRVNGVSVAPPGLAVLEVGNRWFHHRHISAGPPGRNDSSALPFAILFDATGRKAMPVFAFLPRASRRLANSPSRWLSPRSGRHHRFCAPHGPTPEGFQARQTPHGISGFILPDSVSP